MRVGSATDHGGFTLKEDLLGRLTRCIYITITGPAEDDNHHELYLMCDDLTSEIAALKQKGVDCGDVQEARWGSITKTAPACPGRSSPTSWGGKRFTWNDTCGNLIQLVQLARSRDSGSPT